MGHPDKKIINLSLHRSATESFHEFMLAHGFHSAHWPGFEFDDRCHAAVSKLDTTLVYDLIRDVVNSNQVFGDVPYCFLYKQLLTDFPDALYIILLRDIDHWIESVRRHIANRELHNLEKLQYWEYTVSRHSHISDYSDDDLRKIYMKHLVTAANAVQAVGAAIRIFQLNDASLDQHQLSRELAGFLGFEVKSAFPRINVAAARYAPVGEDGTAPAPSPFLYLADALRRHPYRIEAEPDFFMFSGNDLFLHPPARGATRIAARGVAPGAGAAVCCCTFSLDAKSARPVRFRLQLADAAQAAEREAVLQPGERRDIKLSLYGFAGPMSLEAATELADESGDNRCAWAFISQPRIRYLVR